MSNTNALQIDRLLRFWPQSALSDEGMMAYGEAIAGQHPDDVRRAVDAFVLGKLDRNHGFIPPPGEFAAQVTKARNSRLDEEARNRERIAPPPERQPLSDAELQARKEAIARIVAPLRRDFEQSRMANPSPEEFERRRRETIAEALRLDMAGVAEGDPDAIERMRAANAAITVSPTEKARREAEAKAAASKRAQNEAMGIARKSEAVAA